MVWFNMDAIPKSDIKFDIRFGNRFDIRFGNRFDIRIKQMTWIGHETTSFFSQFTIFILLAQNYISNYTSKPCHITNSENIYITNFLKKYIH